MRDLSHLKGSTVLVTGASGFIGSHLVDALLALDCKVHGWVRESSNLQWLDTSQIQIHKVDFSRSDFEVPALGKFDYIFHCAGLTMAKSRDEFFRVNATACASFYNQCQKQAGQIKGIVHLSSLAATGPSSKDSLVNETTSCNPLTYYGQSKLAGEEIALGFSGALPIIVLRPPVVYGPREKFFFNFIKLIRRGWGLQIGSAGRKLSLIYALDLVDAILASSNPYKPNGVAYFTTDGGVYEWEQVAKECATIMNVKYRTLRIPERVLIPVALVCEVLAIFVSRPALFDRQRMIDIKQSSWSASSQKFFDDYEFRPQFDLQRGLTETIKWYQNERWL